MILALNVIMTIIFLLPIMLSIVFVLERKKTLKRLSEINSPYTPFVTVVVPFKGEDYRFEDTLKSLVKQNYSGQYEVIFTSSDSEGKTIDILKIWIPRYSNMFFIPSTIDSRFENRGDKINNLLTGVKNASAQSQVFLFLDSDMVVHKHWINNMVKPLQLENCGLSSGSAWVVAKKKGTWELATRYWDFLAATQITFPFTSFARGLSMGIRRDVYEKLNIDKVWNEAFHDNFTLSKTVRNNKYKIIYAPYAIIEENFDIEGFQWVSWVKRQSVHTRIHYKKLWAFGFFLITLPRLLGALLFIAMIGLGVFFQGVFQTWFSIVLWPLFHILNAICIVVCVYPDTKHVDGNVMSLREKTKLVFASYLSVILSIGSVWAVFSNKITWRKIKYQKNISIKSEKKI
ncbi:glycosyltransferase family 2 protein [Paenibacillus polysaccharolyticus]|uniref:glycosyltransferase n=1 Tax=Paenibacillus polysaccharolyticus TaxID=582692 RepID=UPI0020404D31|nr:glycosyltransferase family 2 protein [Paenibacillus polysaccharolyticus]MCM3135799.1 glycosyltransferase family 2 protein [Paenibacillus polysaccharolyticus]